MPSHQSIHLTTNPLENHTNPKHDAHPATHGSNRPLILATLIIIIIIINITIIIIIIMITIILIVVITIVISISHYHNHY